VLWAPAVATAPPIGTVTEYPIPTASGGPWGIVAGPDGNLWFTENYGNRIGRITPVGTITEFPLPTADSYPLGIAAGPDGNLWFTEGSGNRIGRITLTGTITEYPTPTSVSHPLGIAAGPDGNLWFTEDYGNRIGRITPVGTITEYPIPTASSRPNIIASGPDANLWFTEGGGNKIGRISPTATPAVVKTICPINVTLHKPTPTTVGNRILTDKITTNTSACVLRKPVVLCRPLASTVAGEQAFCDTKVTKRGQIRVNTMGYETVRVTVIVRAKSKSGHADSWKPNTWRKPWLLR
jgi:streptogramin lyase